MRSGREGITESDIVRILEETHVRQVEWREQLGSTNDLALEIASSVDVTTPLLVGATRQTAGRGRGANRWWSSEGALTFSLLQEARDLGDSTRPPQLSLMAAVAVCDSLRSLTPDLDPRLKWPNDVYLNGRKTAGILVEIPPRRPARVVLGMGVNVNNSLAAAPAPLHFSAISVLDAVGRTFDLAELLIRILTRLAELSAMARADPGSLASRWRSYCLLCNRFVRVMAGQRALAGRCRGIDDSGALVLETDSETTRCCSGVVTRFE